MEPEELPCILLGNGVSYEGQWLNGVKHGKGKQTWLDRSKYMESLKASEARSSMMFN